VRANLKLFIMGGLLVAAGLGLFVSPFSSNNPDGLSSVAIDKGFDDSAEEHAFDGSPVANYAVEGVADDRIGKGLSGLIGVLITFGVATLLFGAFRAMRGKDSPPPTGG
jgi:cobalt/nickel transport system permease protein